MTTFSNDSKWSGLLCYLSEEKPKEVVFHREKNGFPSHITFASPSQNCIKTKNEYFYRQITDFYCKL